ncbi:MAG: YicC/YloC family endoribonuclease [Peptococcaceae bacterium]|nr:YicC/YloC family endoribonuclease [Peptococcaceae bacterium]
MYSMTGYASLSKEFDAMTLQIDIKSVNGKYSDLRLNAPAFDNNFLEILRKNASERIVRGQVTVDIILKRGSQAGDLKRIDIEQLRQYQEDFKAAFGGLNDDWSFMKAFLLLDGATKKDELTFDADKDGDFVLAALGEAFDAFYASRAEEGVRLQADLLQKVNQLEATRAAIAARVPELDQAYRERLETRMRDFINDLDEIDEARILSEVAVHAVKSTIDEELVRLGSHFEKLKALLSGYEQLVGKKLDFYMQEVNREYNTIASKVSDIEVAEQIVESKVIVDQIREQAQNIM